MDRRYTCWLTEQGVNNFLAERERILKVELPKLRSGEIPEEIAKEKRKQFLKRILYLNQGLNYNANKSINRSETRHHLRVDIFSSTGYIGDFDSSELLKDRETSIATGSLINLNDKTYCVGNVILKKDGTLRLEVS